VTLAHGSGRTSCRAQPIRGWIVQDLFGRNDRLFGAYHLAVTFRFTL
jgi:hypothetical protein